MWQLTDYPSPTEACEALRGWVNDWTDDSVVSARQTEWDMVPEKLHPTQRMWSHLRHPASY